MLFKWKPTATEEEISTALGKSECLCGDWFVESGHTTAPLALVPFPVCAVLALKSLIPNILDITIGKSISDARSQGEVRVATPKRTEGASAGSDAE